MIRLESPCVGIECNNGKITIYKGKPQERQIVCSRCNGVGKIITMISVLVYNDVNMGDHGEVRISGANVDPQMTVYDLLTKVFKVEYNNVIKLAFVPTVDYGIPTNVIDFSNG